MTVRELKVELASPTLITDGRKSDLLARLLEPNPEPNTEEPKAQEPKAQSTVGGFDISAFLAATPSSAGAPAKPTVTPWDKSNKTIVGFTIDQSSGAIKLSDAAFPSEFKNRSTKEFATTRKEQGDNPMVMPLLPPLQ